MKPRLAITSGRKRAATAISRRPNCRHLTDISLSKQSSRGSSAEWQRHILSRSSISHLLYKDGHEMLTVGGMLVTPAEEAETQRCILGRNALLPPESVARPL